MAKRNKTEFSLVANGGQLLLENCSIRRTIAFGKQSVTDPSATKVEVRNFFAGLAELEKAIMKKKKKTHRCGF